MSLNQESIWKTLKKFFKVLRKYREFSQLEPKCSRWPSGPDATFFKVSFYRCSYISTSPVSLAFCLFSSPCDSTLTLHSLNVTLTSFLPFPLHVLIGYLTLPSVLRPQNTSTTISTYFLYHPNLLHRLLSWISVLIHWNTQRQMCGCLRCLCLIPHSGCFFFLRV